MYTLLRSQPSDNEKTNYTLNPTQAHITHADTSQKKMIVNQNCLVSVDSWAKDTLQLMYKQC